ncbi:hypothetical protein TNCV_1922691 [Trichonephila clavipes]|nr:hypothetical protein TNCV_1922691 [Trichonephila clavipes]
MQKSSSELQAVPERRNQYAGLDTGNQFDCKLLDSFPDGFEVERRHNVCVSHKPSGILLVEDDSKIFYGSGPWNRVVLDVDWRWFSCVASCGEEDCFSFRRVYGDFPFVIPVL